MWNIIGTICFMGMALSPDHPLCWNNATIPMDFENETSCILTRDRLAVDLTVDMNARNVRMILYCAEKKKIDMEKKENNDIEKKEKGKNEQVESTDDKGTYYSHLR